MLRLLQFQLLPLDRSIKPLETPKSLNKGAQYPLEPQRRTPFNPEFPQPRPMHIPSLESMQCYRGRKHHINRPVKPCRTSRKPWQHIIIEPSSRHDLVPRSKECECHGTQPEDDDMRWLPRRLIFCDSDIANVQCLPALAVHVYNSCSCFGEALQGRIEGNGIGFAVDGCDGHGFEGDIGEDRRSSFAGGELLVMSQVVGERYLVVGVHVADDPLLYRRVFGGLTWVCHCIYIDREDSFPALCCMQREQSMRARMLLRREVKFMFRSSSSSRNWTSAVNVHCQMPTKR